MIHNDNHNLWIIIYGGHKFEWPAWLQLTRIRLTQYVTPLYEWWGQKVSPKKVFHCHFNSNFMPLFLEVLLQNQFPDYFCPLVMGIRLDSHKNNRLLLYMIFWSIWYDSYHMSHESIHMIRLVDRPEFGCKYRNHIVFYFPISIIFIFWISVHGRERTLS